MSSFNNPYNASVNPVPEVKSGKLPAALTVIAVLFCIFGAMGIMSLPMMGVGLIAQGLVPAPSVDDPMGQWQKKLNDFQMSFIIPQLALGALNAVLSGFLLMTGIGILKKKLWCVSIGVKTCLAAILFEILRGAFGGYIMFKQTAMMKDIPTPPNVPFDMGQFMNVIMAGAGCFAFGFCILKIGMYIYAMLQLQKPANQALMN